LSQYWTMMRLYFILLYSVQISVHFILPVFYIVRLQIVCVHSLEFFVKIVSRLFLCCIMFSRCLRFNPLPRYLIIFGIILLFCGSYYFDGHNSTLEVLNASENYTKNGPNVQHYKSTTNTTAAKDSSTSSFKSTCSVGADRRGLNQNVISYSIYGKNFSDQKFYNLYLKSFTETLRTIPIKYPGAIIE
jgi:hypothetical protein